MYAKLGLSLLITLLFGCNANTVKQASTQGSNPQNQRNIPISEKEKASYSLGYVNGKGLRTGFSEMSMEKFMEGIETGIAGREARLTDDEINAALQQLQVDMQNRRIAERNAMIEKNSAEGLAFQAAYQQQSGVTTLPSGLQYRVLTPGTGDRPKSTDTVVAHYHGTLINGEIFDSSIDRGEPVTFPLSEVIDGWSEALQKMQVGDKWEVVLPPELAYGSEGTRTIPPGSTLKFEVELLEIK